jgi:hypothetical protein
MFGCTFSFWRRLVGKTSPATTDAPADRRVWVRYRADAMANVQQTQGLENRVWAKVRDISLGGASLLVECRFETGQMLTLELPQRDDGERRTVLACVVRAVPQGDGQWELGCVFSRELSDADLKGSGAKRARHAPTDQRTWVRFASNLKATYQQIGDPENRSYPAQVINLSASGVGLGVAAAVDAGTLLSVDLVGAEGSSARTILACVVQVTTQASGWALGCNFIRELSEQDLMALIKEPSDNGSP